MRSGIFRVWNEFIYLFMNDVQSVTFFIAWNLLHKKQRERTVIPEEWLNGRRPRLCNVLHDRNHITKNRTNPPKMRPFSALHSQEARPLGNKLAPQTPSDLLRQSHFGLHHHPFHLLDIAQREQVEQFRLAVFEV